jgi:hypothetical protein
MIQFALYILQLIAIAILAIFTITFIVTVIIKWQKKKQAVVFALASVASFSATLFVWNIDLFATESENREETIAAFESNFGFNPPSAVKEIKVKNFGIHDSDVHWMAFTYESTVFQKVLAHDQPLQIAEKNTQKYNELLGKLKEGCANCPNWLKLPDNETSRIYFKKDFLDKTFSEYYLWIDSKEKMVYLEVSYFD